MLATANGIITFDAADYAPDATKQYRALFEETGRKIYYAGPLIPQGAEDTSKDPRSEKISQFLDEKLASHGERSVIYVSMNCQGHVHYARSDSEIVLGQISFGSIFWPMDNAKLWAVLDVIIERNIPFVRSFQCPAYRSLILLCRCWAASQPSLPNLLQSYKSGLSSTATAS